MTDRSDRDWAEIVFVACAVVAVGAQLANLAGVLLGWW